jgi:hypothetical protein
MAQLARGNPKISEETRMKMLAGIARARKAPAPKPTEHWAIADDYKGIERAQLVVVNIRSIGESPRGESLVQEVARIRKDPAVFEDVLGFRGHRIPVTAVAAN